MGTMHRREFLRDSAVLSALVAGFGELNVRADEEAKPVKKDDANEQLRVAVVGVHGRDRKSVV